MMIPDEQRNEIEGNGMEYDEKPNAKKFNLLNFVRYASQLVTTTAEGRV